MSCLQSKDVYKNGRLYFLKNLLEALGSKCIKMRWKTFICWKEPTQSPHGWMMEWLKSMNSIALVSVICYLLMASNASIPHPSANPSTRGSKLPWLWFDVEWSAPLQSWSPEVDFQARGVQTGAQRWKTSTQPGNVHITNWKITNWKITMLLMGILTVSTGPWLQ